MHFTSEPQPPADGSPLAQSGSHWRLAIGDSLDPLRADWPLLTDSGLPTAQYAWYASAVDAFAAPVRTLCLRDGADRPAALLVLSDRSWLEHPGQPGARELHEPADLLYRDDQSLEALADALAAHRQSLCCLRLPADSPAVAALRRAYRGRGLLRVTDQGSCPYLPLAGDEVDDLLSSRLRSDLRRARKRAEAMGPVSYQCHAPEPDQVEALYRQALRVEDAGWKGEQGSSLLRDRQRRRFFERYCEYAASERRLRIEFLRIDGQPAAMQIGAEYGRRYWLFKIGYDAHFRSCSPGMLLMLESLRHAAARELIGYELLGRDSAWTRRWTRRERPMVRVRIYGFDGRGLALLANDVLRSLHRRSVRKARRGHEEN